MYTILIGNFPLQSLSPGLVKTEMTADLDHSSFVSDMAILDASDIADACISVLATAPNVLV